MTKVSYVRAILGTWLLIAPNSVLRGRADRPARVFARVLGARHVVEVLVIGRRRGAAWAIAGGAVDSLHAATMLVLAATVPSHRRLALVNTATAGALAAGCFYEAVRAS